MHALAQQALAASLLTGVVMLVLTVGASASTDDAVTRVSAGNQKYWVEQVADGLTLPSSMAWLPNGDMLITERMGGLRILRGSKVDPKAVSGTPASFQGPFDGLKDILLDPDYHTNQMIYLLISEGTFDERHAAVYRARYSAAGLNNVARIFRTKDDVGGYAMFVTRMMFLADKTLLLAVADDHNGERAQQLGSHMGKILRINRDGSVPNDNPFLHVRGALPEIWSFGHRAPLGLYQAIESGVIWEVESGPRGGDELNILKAGGNYGWAIASWGFAYGGGLEAPLQSGPGIENPILVWTPSVTPSSLTRSRGKMYPLWDGDYFVGQLTTRSLERLRIEGSRVVLQERMLLHLEERIRDVKIGLDNHIYLLTDHQNGRVLRLRPGRPRANQLARIAHRFEQSWHPGDASDFPIGGEEEVANVDPSDLEVGRQAFLERCAACHSVGTVVRGGQIGPDLAGVYGRQMGRQAGFDYSPNMAGSVYGWNFATLDRFLAGPERFVPRTKMVSAPVRDAQVRRYIIGFLKQHSSK